MSTSRHFQPRRRSARPAGQPRRPSQFQVPPHHHHVTIDASNVEFWLNHLRESAIKARVENDTEIGDRFDEMADDLAACVAAGWRDVDGRPVRHWHYHMHVTPHPSGLLEHFIELWPEHLAA
ncbi:MAG: hypothetical protein F2681_10180 [Actinobacteria bacterium]|uniref:Unannotated protein n=1 Tax=freshwater metagenome TaxID=449393 RepID=A0A6J7PFD4_9ZZZZ|nr:hypothetical protein [Actinomycetota bacterium]MSW78251.1 hypothetical protein [Actinomycetota bacterium]MSZ83497.1 hypothetical protein [Actinomycetota bacterium]MTB18492.1 hypothetical protein [Actinomycetota bacterium]